MFIPMYTSFCDIILAVVLRAFPVRGQTKKKSQRKHFREPVVSHHLSSGETSVTLLGCVTPAGFSCRDGVESKAHQSVGQSLRQREGGSPLVLQLNSSLDGLFV